MSIISLSMNDEILKQLDVVQREQGFSGRSDAVRAAIRLLYDEHQERKRLRGDVSGVLIVKHEESEKFAQLRHKHARSIRTQLHDHLGEHRCVDILFLRGDAHDITKLAEEMGASKDVQSAKLIVL